MHNRIDFQELKERVSIDQVANMLGLKLRGDGEKLRGPCPICEAEAERCLSITVSKNLWQCFACKESGDMIKLFALVRGLGANRQKEAATEIAGHFLRAPTARTEKDRAFDAEAYGKTLDPTHETVHALGIPESVAIEMGIGYSSKGLMRGRVCFPLRHDDGSIFAFIGYSPTLEPQVKLPKL